MDVSDLGDPKNPEIWNCFLLYAMPPVWTLGCLISGGINNTFYIRIFDVCPCTLPPSSKWTTLQHGNIKLPPTSAQVLKQLSLGNDGVVTCFYPRLRPIDQSSKNKRVACEWLEILLCISWSSRIMVVWWVHNPSHNPLYETINIEWNDVCSTET